MIYVFLANGFEEVEALAPIDLLRRASFEVTTVSITEHLAVIGSHNIPVIADTTIDAIGDFSNADLLVLPGGMPGTKNLAACERLTDLLTAQAKAGKPIAAICAAPSVLGSLGILEGKEAICYPGFEGALKGACISDKRVVRDGNILTAAGAGVAVEFGLAAIEMLADAEKAAAIRKAILAD